MKILCVSCPEGAPEIEEEFYAQHMAEKHPSGQIASIKAKKNVPPLASNLPPGISPNDLPSPEFLKTVEEMEKTEKPQEPLEAMPTPPVAEKKPSDIPPIELTYQYKGNCPTCNTPINTIMVEVKGSLVAVAFCITHKQIDSIEVSPIPKSYKQVSEETEIPIKKKK